MYYRRYELQQRITLFFCVTVIANALSGVRASICSNCALWLNLKTAFGLCDCKHV